MWYDKTVCLVFPAYNEADNIEQAIEKGKKILEESK